MRSMREAKPMEGRRLRRSLAAAALAAAVIVGGLAVIILLPPSARADDPPDVRLQPPGQRIEQTPGAKDPRRPFSPPPDPSKVGLQVVVTLVPGDQAFAALNEGRAAAGKPPLRLSPILAEAARRVSEGMAATGCAPRYEGEGNSSFPCQGWAADQIKAVARSLGYEGDIAIHMGIQVAVECGEAYPVTTELPDCVLSYVESALAAFRSSVVATGDYSQEAGAYAACGRYARWGGYMYHADYACFPVALGGRGAEAPVAEPAATSPPAPGGTSREWQKPAPSPAPVPAPGPVITLPAAEDAVSLPVPATAGNSASELREAASASGIGEQTGVTGALTSLPEEFGSASAGKMETPGEEMLSASSPLPPESGPHPVATEAEGERGRRWPVVGHIADAWKRMWSAISGLLERLG
jgi:hypothetical protein